MIVEEVPGTVDDIVADWMVEKDKGDANCILACALVCHRVIIHTLEG
jgi:hypothetical protein